MGTDDYDMAFVYEIAEQVRDVTITEGASTSVTLTIPRIIALSLEPPRRGT